MIEPVFGTNVIPVSEEYLRKLRDVTRRTGVLLMFDEVITGFRIALGGAHERFGVLPDLATYGKVVGGGAPIGAVAVSRELMEQVNQSEAHVSSAGTFSGNPFTLAAGTAMLEYLMQNRHVYAEMDVKGDRLRGNFNESASSKGYPFCMSGIGPMFQIHQKKGPILKPRDALNQDLEMMNDLHLRLGKVYIPWFHLAFISAAHTEADVDEVLRVVKDSVNAIMNK